MFHDWWQAHRLEIYLIPVWWVLIAVVVLLRCWWDRRHGGT